MKEPLLEVEEAEEEADEGGVNVGCSVVYSSLDPEDASMDCLDGVWGSCFTADACAGLAFDSSVVVIVVAFGCSG